MSSKLCPFCMRMTEDDTCPHCGKTVHYTGLPAHLPAGYVLSGRHPYVLGAALGQGGFGITYIALDMVTNKRVAIKEYYPTYCSTRSNTSTVSAYSKQDDVYLKGKERFLDEARTLKSLSDLKNIVNVLDFFETNNTAYLVMEFLEGSSLKEYAAQNGMFPAQKFLAQIKPLMEDIHRMHERGVIHRDIAPDNIILLPDGQMRLIDFGAARSYVGDKSMTVVVKKGFAPVEQYMSKGSTAATDVYALAATIYYCITGKVPADSAERQYDDTPLVSPSSLGVDITSSQEEALFKAMEIHQKVRTQTVQDFLEELHTTPVSTIAATTTKSVEAASDPGKPPRKKLPVILGILAAVLLLAGGFFLFFMPPGGSAPETNQQTMQEDVTEPTFFQDSIIPVTEAPSADITPESITLKVWAPQVDQETAGSWLLIMLAKFEEAHPEYVITWDVGVCNEGNSAYTIKNAPSAAADVYFYTNDQMGTLIEAGALAKLGGSYLESVKANFAQTHVDLLTYTDGGVYGFPTAPNTWFMWYNKSVFSEEDIKSLNTMLEKGVVSFPMDNSWYTGTFFFGVGGTVFGPQGIDAAAGIDFGSDLCVEAAKFMVDMAKNPNFVNDVDGAGVVGMLNGTVHAMFSGDWDEPNLAPLGDDLGCAALPTFTLANGSTYQMKSFASNKAVGVNPNASNPKAAMQLAQFLTSAESLALRYELSGYVPASSDVRVDSELASVLNAQMSYATIPQPCIPEMANFWDPVRNFGLKILNGSITHANAAEMLEATIKLLNKTGR